jgi:hypothetical protein
MNATTTKGYMMHMLNGSARAIASREGVGSRAETCASAQGQQPQRIKQR